MASNLLRGRHAWGLSILLTLLTGCGEFGIVLPAGRKDLSSFTDFRCEYRFATSSQEAELRDAVIHQEDDGRYTVQLTVYHPSQEQGEPGTEERLPARDLTDTETTEMLELFSSVQFLQYIPLPGGQCPTYIVANPVKVFTRDGLTTSRCSCSLHPEECLADSEVTAIYDFLQSLVPEQ